MIQISDLYLAETELTTKEGQLLSLAALHLQYFASNVQGSGWVGC